MNETILKEKLEALRAKLEADHLVQLIKSGVDCDANRHNAKCTVKLGQKYARVDVGTSGKLMVELATGHIFGIKAYGVIHRGIRMARWTQSPVGTGAGTILKKFLDGD